MIIHLSRDDVASSDDVGLLHRFVVPDNTELPEILRLILVKPYLATLAGGKATWSVVSNIPVAVVAQQWPEAKLIPNLALLSLTDLDFSEDTLYLHFNYHGQIAPEVVYEILWGLNLTATR